MTNLQVDQWLIGLLKSNATILNTVSNRIFSDVAPENATYPLVTISQVVCTPDQNMSGDKVMDEELWMVKATAEASSYRPIKLLVKAILETLHKASGVGVVGCVEDSRQQITEVVGSRIFKTYILYFRLYTQ